MITKKTLNIIMKIILKIITILAFICVTSCNKKVVTQSTTTEIKPLPVEEIELSIDSSQLKDTVFFTKYDTVVQDSIQIKYVWNEDTQQADISVDCPDCEEKIVTHIETIDLSDKTKSRIENKERKRADKEIEKSRKQWVKDGKKEGRKQGRNQTIVGMALLVGLYLVARFKFKLPI